MTTIYLPGDRVETLTGFTRGVVTEVPNDRCIDVLADTGNKYRNCLASKWRHEAPKPEHAQRKTLIRGDRCHIILNLADDADEETTPSTMSGTVLVGGRDRCYVQFDAEASRWVGRIYLHDGEGSNDL